MPIWTWVPTPWGSAKGIARFSATTTAQFLRSAGIHGLPAPGSCILYPYDVDADGVGVNAYGPAIDAGAALRVTGTRGVVTLDKRDEGSYKHSLPKGFIEPGAYTIDNGDGGADVGAFSVTVTVPTPVTWTNKAKSYSLSRFSVPTIEWSGGQPGSFVSLFSMTRNNIMSPRYTKSAPRAPTPAHSPSPSTSPTCCL